MGRLGYMTDIPFEDAKTVLPPIIDGHYEIDERSLLEASVWRNDQEIHRGLALNDVVVNRSGLSGMVELKVHVNGSFMYNQRSDGLIVSTQPVQPHTPSQQAAPFCIPACQGLCWYQSLPMPSPIDHRIGPRVSNYDRSCWWPRSDCEL